MSSVVPTDTLQAAQQALRRERRQLEDERHAFEQFLGRVRALEPNQSRSGPAGPAPLAPRRRTGLERVRDAYTETVMCVPHYHEEYDEAYAEHLAGELGEELAAAVTKGSQLHPSLKRSLVDAARQAVGVRESVIELLDDEADTLERAKRDLSELLDELASLLDQPLDHLEFNALRLTRERLQRLRTQCDDLAARRQDVLRRRRQTGLIDLEDFGLYLYDECPSTYPLLSVIADVGRLIDRTLARIDRSLLVTT